VIVCPKGALVEQEKVVGKIEIGNSNQVEVRSGILNTGEPSGVPIINRLQDGDISATNDMIFVDCPPGSACVVMDSIKDADYCVLVAEPTVFGVHNLNMVYELVELFEKPFGVVLNKSINGENPAEQFCIDRNIKILGKIPFDTELGEISSNAKIAVRESKKYRDLFSSLLNTLKREVAYETTSNS
ncbi:MAG: ATPase, partial [Clostridiales bacterium]|nr:ATPase [Clostridiales bacterium]